MILREHDSALGTRPPVPSGGRKVPGTCHLAPVLRLRARYQELLAAGRVENLEPNEAERDLGMMKTLRSLAWSRRFATVCIVIASAKKRSVDVYEVMQKLFTDPVEAEKLLFNT